MNGNDNDSLDKETTEIEINGTPETIKKEIAKIAKIKNLFKGLHMNIRNQVKNIEQLRILIDTIDMEFAFIGLSECWKTEEELKLQDIEIEGYESAHTKDKFNKNGGVHIYVNKKYHWKQIKEEDIQGAENIEIEMIDKSSKEKFIVMIWYRNPNREINVFYKSINMKLKNKYYRNKSVVIMGDINVDLLSDRKEKKEIENLMNGRGT